MEVMTIYVQVPIPLLEGRLPMTAKLVAMLMLLPEAQTPQTLEKLSGLSRPTVLRALALLEAAGWHTSPAAPQAREVQVSTELLVDPRLSAREKLVYTRLQAGPSLAPSTHASLARQVGLTPYPLKQALHRLAATGWMQVTQQHRRSLVEFTLGNPFAEYRASIVAPARRRLNKNRYKGETYMREWLNLLVAGRECTDDATPDFLENPFTGEKMELDRYYPPNVALEFQGPQHFTTTEWFPDEVELRKQQARDHMKRGFCEARGITLIAVTAEDLSLEGMRAKLGDLLPLRDLRGHEAWVRLVESYSRSYREEARQPLPPPKPKGQDQEA